ncbi:hypothetical protein BKA65DRAFT_471688 [Rhexocercosporidium sp. MPI-PUGE-AT-0058]|nr:hypothetical protein BKA65DRAFT_471688 [Rhexocercosporidium sp. MPI-PUGE-AT-0058]
MKQVYAHEPVEPQTGQRLSFLYSEDGCKRVESFAWYRDNGLSGWTRRAKKNVEADLQALAELLYDNTDETTKLAKLTRKFDKEMSQNAQDSISRDQQAEEYADSLTKSGNANYLADVEATLNKRYNERLRESSALYDNKAKGRVLSKKKETMAFVKTLMEVERVPLSYPGRNRSDMLEIANALYTKQPGARQQLDRIIDLRGFTTDPIKSIRKIFEEEDLDYKNMLEHIRTIYTKKDVVELPQTGVIPIPPRASELIRPKFSLLGTGMSTAEATGILAAEYTFERQPQGRDVRTQWLGVPCYHDELTGFFTSPDVFPIFRNKEALWTLEEFVETVNDHVTTLFTVEVLGAFIHYSHRFRQLFHFTFLTNRIETLQGSVTGWETCEEHSVDGPLRSRGIALYRKPKGLEDIETLILENILDFRDEPREGFAGNLLDRINIWRPKKKIRLFFSDRAIKDETFTSFMIYWSLTGTFFVYDNPLRVTDDNFLEEKIIHIDNGWSVDWGTKYELPSPLPVLAKMERLFRDIKSDIYDL